MNEGAESRWQTASTINRRKRNLLLCLIAVGLVIGISAALFVHHAGRGLRIFVFIGGASSYLAFQICKICTPREKVSIFSFFRRRETRRPDRVSFTDEAITRVRPDGVEEKIRWDELHEVVVLTTDEGPFQEDVFFLLIASDGKPGCAVPQGAEGCERLLERLQKLPGFNNEAVITAMGSTSNAKFVCWRRPLDAAR